MAKATKTAPVTETKVVEIEPGKVTLELTLDEANGLRTIVGRIGGTGSLRDISNTIYSALGLVSADSSEYAGQVQESMKVRPAGSKYDW